MNKISFVVVDISHTEPWVINTYTLTIKRLSLSNPVLQFSAKSPHQVCSFIQVFHSSGNYLCFEMHSILHFFQF